ncbi:MAG TPA: C40 family peptidase [Saprospiraceae bacterium]|nr:C40 family peptidase [Saprospiraceae bacterium]HMP13943.1 C40 family peptidase [Saprospiraceae bacterium]
MMYNRLSFIQITDRIKHVALLLLMTAITVRCEFLRDLTTEPTSRPDATTTAKSPTADELKLRKEIVNYAQQYQGVRYRAAGKNPKDGFDCSGFTSYVMNQFDIRLSASSQTQAKQGKFKTIDKVEPGDLIFFRRSPKDSIFHVALVVSNNRKSLQVIHSTSRGVVIDDILASEYWRPKIDSARDVVHN